MDDANDDVINAALLEFYAEYVKKAGLMDEFNESLKEEY
jgi:hypothetical protein